MNLTRTVRTVETVEVDYGSRGPIVTGDPKIHDSQRYEIVRAVRTTDGTGVETVAWGLPVRADGKRKSNAVYPSPVYGDEAERCADAMLSNPLAVSR